MTRDQKAVRTSRATGCGGVAGDEFEDRLLKGARERRPLLRAFEAKLRLNRKSRQALVLRSGFSDSADGLGLHGGGQRNICQWARLERRLYNGSSPL